MNFQAAPCPRIFDMCNADILISVEFWPIDVSHIPGKGTSSSTLMDHLAPHCVNLHDTLSICITQQTDNFFLKVIYTVNSTRKAKSIL